MRYLKHFKEKPNIYDIIKNPFIIAVNSEEKAKKLFEIFQSEGIKWRSGSIVRPDRTNWSYYGVDTLYIYDKGYSDKIRLAYGNTIEDVETLPVHKFDDIDLENIKRRIK